MDEQEKVEIEIEEEVDVTITIPVEDAVKIILGGYVESDVLRNIIRKQVVSQVGYDVYVDLQDKNHKKLMAALSAAEDQIISLQETNNKLTKKIKARENN